MHLIYLRSGSVVLTRRPYASWRDLQDQREEYLTSLEFADVHEVIGFFEEDFGEERRQPLSRRQLLDFAASGSENLIG